MKKTTQKHLPAEPASASPVEMPFGSALLSASASRLVAQMEGARWPTVLGAVLTGARLRKGLSRRLAARKLRQRLRKKTILKASRTELRRWEKESVSIVPWLLVEYLEAIEAPVEDWIQVLIEFATASGDSGYRRNVIEILLHVERATDQERKQLLPTLKAWVELQAMMVGFSWRMQLVSGAIAELVPGVAFEPTARLADGAAGLGERVEALSAQLAGLLERAGGGPSAEEAE